MKAGPVWQYFLPLLGLGLLLRLWFGLTTDTLLHPDEIMQYLEQAHRLAFGYGMTPWEYQEGTRSYIIAGLIGGLLSILNMLGFESTAVYIPAVKCVLILLSLLIPAGMYFYCRHHFSEQTARVALIFGCFWYELIIFSFKPLPSFLATEVLLLALMLSVCKQTVLKTFLVGAVCALVVALRIQLAPLMLLVALVLMFHLPVKQRGYFIGGGLAGVFGAGLLDYLTWGVWWGSYYGTLYWNLIEGKAATFFGEQPMYYYLWLLGLANVGVFYLSVGFAGVMAWRNTFLETTRTFVHYLRGHSFLLAAIVIVVISHSLIGHKEYRFIFVVIPLWLMIAADLSHRLGVWRTHIAKAVVLVISIFGLINQLPLQKNIYEVSGVPLHEHFTEKDAGLQAYLWLGEQKGIRAVLDRFNVMLAYGGGYYYLHKRIPVFGSVQYEKYCKDIPYKEAMSHVITDSETTQLDGFLPIKAFTVKNGKSAIVWKNRQHLTRFACR